MIRSGAEGAHTFRVRAINGEGTGDSTPVVCRWKVTLD